MRFARCAMLCSTFGMLAKSGRADAHRREDPAQTTQSVPLSTPVASSYPAPAGHGPPFGSNLHGVLAPTVWLGLRIPFLFQGGPCGRHCVLGTGDEIPV